MKKKLLLLAFLPALMPSFGATWFTYGGHEYAVTSGPASWTWSQTEALANGGNLATIDDAAEETWINTTFGGAQWWIGFTDQDVEGAFEWIDGSPVTYTNWAPSEPNNSGGEDYTVMNWSAGRWNDLPDGVERFGIIERDLDQPVPEVQTYASLLGAALVGGSMLRKRRKGN